MRANDIHRSFSMETASLLKQDSAENSEELIACLPSFREVGSNIVSHLVAGTLRLFGFPWLQASRSPGVSR